MHKYQLLLRNVANGNTPCDTSTIVGEFSLPKGFGFNVVKNDQGGFAMEVVELPKVESVEAEVVD